MSYLYLRAKYRSFLYWWCIENTSRRHIINMLTRYTNAQIQNTLVVVVNTLSTVLTFKMTVLPKNWLFSQLKFKSLFLGPHSSEVWLQRTLLGFFCSLKELEYHSGPPTQCKKNPHWTYTHNRASFLVEKGFESERVIMAVRRRDPFKMYPFIIESFQTEIPSDSNLFKNAMAP